MNDSRRGVVLVPVLWLIALLSALAIAASITFRGFGAVIALDRDRVQADALLTAGVEAAAHTIDVLGDTPLDQMDVNVVLSHGSVRAHLSDEGGRIDIGKAPVEVLAALFRSVGVPAPESENIARSVAKWHQPATDPRNKDVASPDVRAEATHAGPPFSDIRQLLQIPGMLPEWVSAIAPLTTVYGSETVNPLTAPAEVIAALPGVDLVRVNAFIQTRANRPVDSSAIAAMLGTAQQYLDVKTQPVTRVDLAVSLADGFSESAQAVILVRREDQEPYRVLVWNPSSRPHE